MTRLINSQNVNDQLFRRYNIAILLIVITASFAVGLVQLLGLIERDLEGVVGFIGDHSPWFGAGLVLVMFIIFMSVKYLMLQHKNYTASHNPE